MMKTNFLKSVLVAIVLVFGFTTLRAASDKTVKDLQAAFTGESTASAKYTAFAKKAREEGKPESGRSVRGSFKSRKYSCRKSQSCFTAT